MRISENLRSGDLITGILNLDLLYNKATSIKPELLSCTCRLEYVRDYLSRIQGLLPVIYSFEFLEFESIINQSGDRHNKISYIKESLNKYNHDSCIDPNLFLFYNRFKRKFEDSIISDIYKNRFNLEISIDRFFDLLDFTILLISGVSLNCQNLNKNKAPSDEFRESINLIATNLSMDSLEKSYIDDTLSILLDSHNLTNNIDIIFDFKLIECKISSNLFDKWVPIINSKFKSISIINYGTTDLSNIKPLVNDYLNPDKSIFDNNKGSCITCNRPW